MLSGRHGLVADFGVARALSNATGGNQITSLGVALGTPSYMSPEQATADPSVDHRTDIYSVGCMAYELIAGTLPFTGTSPQKVLSAHVMETPAPLSKHREGISPVLEHAIMRCLAKKPADRWQTAEELLAVLEPLSTPSAGMAPTSARLAPVRPTRRLWLIPASIAAVLIAGVFAYGATRPLTPSLSIGASTQLTTAAGLQIHPALSPDGKLVAYAAGTSRRMRIFIQPVTGGRVIPLSDDTTSAETNPRWSSDGTQLLVLSGGGVSVAPALGGALRPVVAPSAEGPVRTADWSPDNREIAFVRSESLLVQPLDGKPARFVGTSEDLSDCRWSPGGRMIACVSGNSPATRPGPTFGNSAPSAIMLFPANGGGAHPLTDSRSLHQSPAWSEDGTRLYFISDRDGTRDIYEIVIGRNEEPRGAAMRLSTGLNAHSVSVAGGHIAYGVYSSKANIWTLPIPGSGTVSAEGATPLTNVAQIVESVQTSRDGKWLLFDATRSGRADIYRMPVAGGQEERLIHEGFDVFAPALSPDGRLLAYHSFRSGNRDIEVKPLDGGPVEIVTNSPRQESYPAWSPDGKQLAFFDQRTKQGFTTKRLAPGRWSTPVAVGDELRAEWISNSELLFVSSDTSQIHVRTLPGKGDRLLYTASSRSNDSIPIPESVLPSWDGTSVFFKAHDTQGRASFWRVPIAGGAPQKIVQFPNVDHRSNRRDFGVDAKRFYFTFEDQQSNIWIADVTRPK
jgi:Tol biopolymer transport system component